jgi:hypothetical protein
MARRPRFSPSQFFLLRHRLYDLAQAPNRQNIVSVGTVGALPPVTGWLRRSAASGSSHSVPDFITEGSDTADPKLFFLKAAILSWMRSLVTYCSNWAKDSPLAPIVDRHGLLVAAFNRLLTLT